jgi:maleylacetoacetate isomerase/maleylpyruvate isomerase
MSLILYDYWRSSAAFRVRIALRLKGLDYEARAIDLRGDEQSTEAYRTPNPQGLVPCLIDEELTLADGAGLGQSLAIIDHLDERYPDPPLLPADPAMRARARSLALSIACDIHPLNNLRVQRYLHRALGIEQPAIDIWLRHWITTGFAGLEAAAEALPGPYLVGDRVTIADICLVPQMYNARRAETDLAPFPRLRAIEERLLALPAFHAARPEAQPDAPDSA